MPDFIANTQISVPLQVQGVKPDVDLNGLKFSYEIGVFYDPAPTLITMTLPPPITPSTVSRPKPPASTGHSYANKRRIGT